MLCYVCMYCIGFHYQYDEYDEYYDYYVYYYYYYDYYYYFDDFDCYYFIHIYIYSIYSKYQGKYLRILDDQERLIHWPFPPRSIAAWHLADLCQCRPGISGDSRMEPQWGPSSLAFSWCKYPLVNIQKAIENGHL